MAEYQSKRLVFQYLHILPCTERLTVLLLQDLHKKETEASIVALRQKRLRDLSSLLEEQDINI